jgi:hypothetical protein
VTVLKGIFLKGNPVRILVLDAIFLLFFAVIIFIVANRKFRKKII